MEKQKISQTNELINNELYHSLGERWYTAYDDPVALLRAESKLRNPWVQSILGNKKLSVLDIGCGGGFLSNYLAAQGHHVTGVDLSQESLDIAREYDVTKSVNYISCDARKIPFPDKSFDAITCMDFLEHVDNPEDVIKEAARLLKPNGYFFFHTFNKNPIARLVVIKGVEWFVKNTPEHMHVYDLFIKPETIVNSCKKNGMSVVELHGVRPKLNRAFFKLLSTREVPKDFQFEFCKSTLVSYSGYAKLSG